MSGLDLVANSATYMCLSCNTCAQSSLGDYNLYSLIEATETRISKELRHKAEVQTRKTAEVLMLLVLLRAYIFHT